MSRKREGWHVPTRRREHDAGLRWRRPPEPIDDPVESAAPKSVPPEDEDRRPISPFVPVRCPRCGKSKRETYARRGRIRYHRCADCGIAFKSLEYPPSQVRE